MTYMFFTCVSELLTSAVCRGSDLLESQMPQAANGKQGRKRQEVRWKIGLNMHERTKGLTGAGWLRLSVVSG